MSREEEMRAHIESLKAEQAKLETQVQSARAYQDLLQELVDQSELILADYLEHKEQSS